MVQHNVAFVEPLKKTVCESLEMFSSRDKAGNATDELKIQTVAAPPF